MTNMFFSTEAIARFRLFETAMSNIKNNFYTKIFNSIEALIRTLKIPDRGFSIFISWMGDDFSYQFKLPSCLIIGIYL